MIRKRICPLHGPWNKANKDDRCPECKTNRNKEYNKHQRNKEFDKIYKGSRWKSVRLIQLNNNPFCVVCGCEANRVDHIIEIKDGGAVYYSNNLQSMCISCHNTKTFKAKKDRENKDEK